MSWEDWSSSVRDAASQALGKTGHGKVATELWPPYYCTNPASCVNIVQLLHDELVRRLGSDQEVVRLDALRKVNYLELMTPQLLAAFLPSFSDNHASIKTEAIAVLCILFISHSMCLHHL